MHKLSNRMIAILLVVVVICSMIVPVSAANRNDTVSPQASSYISNVWASASRSGSTITVDFDITATGKMTSLGATTVSIRDSSGTLVKTFSHTTTSSMMGSNRTYYSSSVKYTGASASTKYYAIVYYKASDSNGYDTTSYTTTMV